MCISYASLYMCDLGIYTTQISGVLFAQDLSFNILFFRTTRSYACGIWYILFIYVIQCDMPCVPFTNIDSKCTKILRLSPENERKNIFFKKMFYGLLLDKIEEKKHFMTKITKYFVCVRCECIRIDRDTQ